MQIISSDQNSLIKYVKSLQLKKHRDFSGEYLIEGIKLIKEAISCDVGLNSLFYQNKACDNPEVQDIIDLCTRTGIPVYGLEEKPYKEISETKTPQGVIAIGKKNNYDMSLLANLNSFQIVLLEEVQDPGNVGTIIRTADACGFDLAILSKGCADIYSGKTIRSTMGSVFHIPIITDADMRHILSTLDELGVMTIAAAPHAGISCFDIEYKDNCAVIIGNESKGLSDTVMDMVKIKANIPMVGRAESLNAGVAASIMMYEIMKYKLILNC